jgi:D-amino-acid dehydrogenase
MGEALRFAGTLELAGLDLSVNLRRVRAIERAAQRFLPGLGALEHVETWRGLRPCTPDDRPVIGRHRAVANLVLATGHGMSGIAQGPITGKLVAQLLAGERPDVDVSTFSPDRF